MPSSPNQMRSQLSKPEFVSSDEIVVATKSCLDPRKVLAEIRVQIAEEQAALKYQRLLAESQGKDTSLVSAKRIDALVKLAAIELDFQKARIGRIDVHGEQFRKVMAHFLDTVMSVIAATITNQETVDLFYNHLSTRMGDWEKELEAKLD